MTQLSPEQFIKKWEGREISGWSRTGGQCTDMMREMMLETMGIDRAHLFTAIAAGDAHDVWTNANPNYFHKVSGGYIRRTPGFVIPEWAICVLNHGYYGHVFMAFKGSTHQLIRGWGQNWTHARRCDYEAHGLTELIGILERR